MQIRHRWGWIYKIWNLLVVSVKTPLFPGYSVPTTRPVKCEPKFYTFLSQKMAVPLPVAQAPPVIERFRTFFPTRTTLHPKATCCRTNFACSLQPHKEKLRTNSVVCLSASTSSPGTNPFHCLFCKTIWISFMLVLTEMLL